MAEPPGTAAGQGAAGGTAGQGAAGQGAAGQGATPPPLEPSLPRRGAQGGAAQGVAAQGGAALRAKGGVVKAGQKRKRNRDDSGSQFARDLISSFGELLHQPAAVVDRMRPLGPDPAAQGDGLLALPTLVHRGPGGNDAQALDRSVLFFTVVPLFDDDAEGKKIGEYDADAQIHAGWLLAHAGAHAGGGLTQEEEKDVLDSYESLGYYLRQFGKGEKVRWQKQKVKEEGEPRRARKRKATDASPSPHKKKAANQGAGSEAGEAGEGDEAPLPCPGSPAQ